MSTQDFDNVRRDQEDHAGTCVECGDDISMAAFLDDQLCEDCSEIILARQREGDKS